MAIYIEVLHGLHGPVLGLTDGNGSGLEIAGPHSHEWGYKIHSFKLTESAVKDILARLSYAMEHDEFKDDVSTPAQTAKEGV